jgi:hypothetical protein
MYPLLVGSAYQQGIQTMITPDRLRELIHYDPETGIFMWRKRANDFGGWNKKFAHTQAGRAMKRRIPYRQIRVDNKQYYAHRLAFLYMTGEWPIEYVDHIDGDGLNNRWNNLRAATNQQNQFNSGKSATNTSGYKGVCWDKNTKKWQAQIRINKKSKYLGQYATPEEASAAYQCVSRLYHGEFLKK